MEIRDLIVTPMVLMVVYLCAYLIRPFATDELNRQYFIPGLTVKIFGALALGMIYQFYYQGGDTYNFHTHGSRHIWDAFWDSPEKGLKLLFADGTDEKGIYKYSSRIAFFRDSSSYTVIRIAAFLDLFTFSAYSATAVLFAVFSFIGSWLLFKTFYEDNPQLKGWIALATIFIPSVIFWGSGLLKDTITLGALGICTYMIRKIFLQKQISIGRVLILIFFIIIIYQIKKYILLCYLPAVLFWIFRHNFRSIKSQVMRAMMLPFVLGLMIVIGYFAVMQIGKEDARYDVRNIGATARITAYDIAFQTGRDAGSTYALGELDGTFEGMLQLAPQAVNVSLFRPYLWEVRNPLMLMSAIESLALLVFTLFVLVKSFRYLPGSLLDSNVSFCLLFSLTFAFAVGVSTFNFGTLSRYKIPLIPFYLLSLILIYHISNRERKLEALDVTE